MTDREKAARAIGYLEGFSAIVWVFVGEKLADEMATGFDDAVETLRKALLCDEKGAGGECMKAHADALRGEGVLE